MRPERKTLDLMPVGAQMIVLSIEGDDILARRLMEMGVMEGEPVELVARAPLGDPIEIRLTNAALSLRNSEAKRVVVAEAGQG